MKFKKLLKEANNYGYHAGDLGKAETRKQQSGGRGTGHFGTGTYFVSNPDKIKNYNMRDGKEAPKHIVDFSSYNLYKPSKVTKAYDLHDCLKTINELYTWYSPVLDAYKNLEALDISNSDWDNEHIVKSNLKEVVENLNKLIRYKHKKSPDYYDGEEIPYEQDYDDFDNVWEKTYDIFKEYYQNEGCSLVDAMDKAEEEADKMYDEANEYYANIVKKLKEVIRLNGWTNDFTLANRVRTLPQDLYNALEGKHSMQDIEKALRAVSLANKDMDDSNSTIFMKTLGYEGIDVRHLKDEDGLATPDNTGYGSVIYDVKPETIVEDLSQGQQDYFKNSKIRDKDGNLLVVYHGTPNAGFDEFNPKNNKSQFGNYKFGDYNVNYFTKDKDSARSYTNIGIDEGNNLYACYLNIVNPYIVDNKTEAEMKSSFNIKDDRLRQKEVQLFDRIFNKWKNKILDYSDFRFNELNKDLNKINLELRPSDIYKENTDPEDIEYFDLYNLGNNSFFGAEHPAFYQYSTDELFSDDMYDELRETIIGEDINDYYFSTDDIVRYVISLNEEDGEDYDGIIIPDIIDSKEMFSAITTDYITLKSSNQIKLIDNINPTSSNKINEDFDFDKRLLYKSPNYTKEVKPNCIRLYHQTNKNNINSIIDNGLLTKKARQYDNPGNCIWLSEKLPDSYSWNYGNSLIELDIPNELIDGSNFRKVNNNEYNCWFDIKPEYINAIYLQTPYRTPIMKDFQNTRDIDKSIERFQNGELTERASDYKMLTKTNVNQPYERYWFAKTFKDEKSKKPEIHKVALQLQTDDINIVDEILKEIIPYNYDRLRIFGSTNNLDNLKKDGYQLLSLTEGLRIISDEDTKFDNKVKKENIIVDIYYDRHERMYAISLKDKSTGNILSDYDYAFTRKEAEILKQDMLEDIQSFIYDVYELEESLKESKTFEYPEQLINDAINYYWKDRNVKIETLPIKQLVDDNELLNDDDLQSYHQRLWDNKKANEFSIDNNKVKNYRLSEIPYAVRKKDGKLELGDGRHRTRALYNDGYEYVKLPVITEDINESLLTEENKSGVVIYMHTSDMANDDINNDYYGYLSYDRNIEKEIDNCKDDEYDNVDFCENDFDLIPCEDNNHQEDLKARQQATIFKDENDALNAFKKVSWWVCNIPFDKNDTIKDIQKDLFEVFKIIPVYEENENTFKYKNKEYFTGSVNTLDGIIEEVHTYKEAEDADFHHSLTFSDTQVHKINDGECAIFFVDDNNKLYIDPTSRSRNLDEDTIRFLTYKVLSQITILKKNIRENLLIEVYPHKGESKKDFTKRFMKVTKDEYPDIKQRYAVCMSYWSRRNKKK